MESNDVNQYTLQTANSNNKVKIYVELNSLEILRLLEFILEGSSQRG